MKNKWPGKIIITVQIQVIFCLLFLPLSTLAQYVPSPQAPTPSPSNTGTSRQFTDKERDETDLNYFKARYYDSRTGKFNQADPVMNNLHNEDYIKQTTGGNLENILQNPQNLNTYNYTNNNPIKRVDNDGKWFKEVLTGKQSLSDFNLEYGQAGEALYNDNSVAKVIMNHPVASGVAIGMVSGIAATTGSWLLGQGGLVLPFVSKTIDYTTRYGKEIGEKMNEVFNGLQKISDANKFTEHSIFRISDKLGIGGERKVVDIINNVKPFEYFHDGFNKLGYYDSVSKIFIGQIRDTQMVTTVIVNVAKNYIENLMK